MSAVQGLEPAAPRAAPVWRSLAPRRDRLLTGLTAAGLFLAWRLVTRYGLVNPLFLPSPEAVWAAFVKTATEGYQGSLLHEHLAASLWRVLAGYKRACLIGIPLGLVMGLSRDVKTVFDPIIERRRWLAIPSLSCGSASAMPPRSRCCSSRRCRR